jgi:hypothetical protein
MPPTELASSRRFFVIVAPASAGRPEVRHSNNG